MNAQEPTAALPVGHWEKRQTDSLFPQRPGAGGSEAGAAPRPRQRHVGRRAGDLFPGDFCRCGEGKQAQAFPKAVLESPRETHFQMILLDIVRN